MNKDKFQNQLASIETIFKDVIKESFVSISQYDNLKQELSKELLARDDQLKQLKKTSLENEELTKKIEELQQINKEASDKYQEQILTLKLNYSIESFLKDHGSRNVKSILSHLDLSKLKINDNGSIDGLDQQVQSLLADSNTNFLFHEKKQEVTEQKKQDVSVVGGFKPVDKVISSIDPSKSMDLESILKEIIINKGELYGCN